MISRSEYDKVLAQLIQFLDGKHEPVTRSLKKKMEDASEALRFEQAARFRDQLQAVQSVVEGQSYRYEGKGRTGCHCLCG
jgi:excinuclease ABC subunit C